MKSLVVFLLLSLLSHLRAECVFKNVTVVLKASASDLDQKQEKSVVIDCDDSIEKYVKSHQDFPVEKIRIASQEIPELKENSFANLESVVSIDITSCGIKTIHPGAFKNLPKLKELKITFNPLENIKYGVFSNIGTKDLDELILDFNKISQIDDHVFEDLNIRRLSISVNKLSNFKRSWFRNTFIEELAIWDNLIEELPDSAFIFNDNPGKTPKHIHVSRNRITKIGKDVFKGVDHLKTLYLASNFLDHLEPQFVNEVDHLGLYNNSFTSFDLKPLRGTKINYLDLRKNKLECVSTEIFKVIPLSEVDLEENPVTCECMKTWFDWVKANKKEDAVHFDLEDEERCHIEF